MPFTASYLLLWLIVGFLAFLSVGLTAELRRLRASSHAAVTVGQQASNVRGFDLRTRAYVDIPIDTEAVLLFLSPTCSVCHGLLERLCRSSEEISSRVGLIVGVCVGDSQLCDHFAVYSSHQDVRLVCDSMGETAADYGVSSYPTAMIVKNRKVSGYGYPGNVSQLIEVWDSVTTAA